MKRHAIVAAPVALGLSLLCMAGCGSIPPTNIDIVEGQPFPPGEVVVLGRVSMLEETGEPIDFGEPRSVNFILGGYRNLTTVHVMVGDSVEGQIPLRADGTFFWHLKPGEYSLIGTTRYSGSNYLTQYKPSRGLFSLLPSDSAIYIGTLILSGTPEVRDEYESAVQKMKAQIPGVAVQPRSRLMQLRPQQPPKWWSQ